MRDAPLISLVFSGKDHRPFLHRMFTHDFQQLPEDHFRFAALCTHKGRVIANGLFLAEGEQTRMVLPREQATIVQETLLRFRLRDQVEIHEDAQNWTLAWQGTDGVAGEGVLEPLKLLPAGEAAGDWMDAACQAGLAMITAQDREQHVPQTLNMDLAEGIHFNKGCYPGQEVVARLHYLGKPKNRSMHFTSTGPVDIGQEVFAKDKPTEVLGTCILAGKSGHLLCTVKTHCLQGSQEAALAAGPGHHPLHMAGLPYEL